LGIGYGMAPDGIYAMSIAQFFFELQGYIQRDHREWERTRLNIFWLASAAGAKLKSPKDIMTTVFDRSDLDEDDLEAIRNWGEVMARKAGWITTTTEQNG
jgi:hypothetical protein